MPFQFSRCIFLQLPNPAPEIEFYEEVVGLDVLRREGDAAEFKAGVFRLVIGPGEQIGPIIEFLVPDVEVAREEMLRTGCEVVLWEGREGWCRMRDPSGFVFNLYEAPDAFFE